MFHLNNVKENGKVILDPHQELDKHQNLIASPLALGWLRGTVGRTVPRTVRPANFPCPALDLQLMGDHLYG